MPPTSAVLMLRAPVRALKRVVLAALPQGGQARSRRNAWAGRSADAVRARREAEAALAAAGPAAQVARTAGADCSRTAGALPSGA